jgi:hypothetical protein
VKAPFKPEPSTKLTFDWVFRQFNAIAQFLNTEGGERTVSEPSPTDSPYTVQPWDEVIFADSSTGNVTIQLPVGVDLRELYIKNSDAPPGANTVTVVADTGSPDFIDYNVSVPLAHHEAIHILYNQDKANWFIL